MVGRSPCLCCIFPGFCRARGPKGVGRFVQQENEARNGMRVQTRGRSDRISWRFSQCGFSVAFRFPSSVDRVDDLPAFSLIYCYEAKSCQPHNTGAGPVQVLMSLSVASLSRSASSLYQTSRTYRVILQKADWRN